MSQFGFSASFTSERRTASGEEPDAWRVTPAGLNLRTEDVKTKTGSDLAAGPCDLGVSRHRYRQLGTTRNPVD